MLRHINVSTYLGKATERTYEPQETGISSFGLKEIINSSRVRKHHEAATPRG